MDEAIKALAEIGKSLTSPAKLAFGGYVLLAFSGKIGTSIFQFMLVAGIFFILQALHDDFLRFALNEWGTRLGKCGSK